MEHEYQPQCEFCRDRGCDNCVTTTIKESEHKEINQDILDQLNEFLKMDHAVQDAGKDEILHSETIKFNDGMQADIKLVNSESGHI